MAAYLKKNQNAPYIVGERWAQRLFPNGRANKEWLDSMISDRPAILRDETRHGAVVNTAMLKFAGITKETPQPKGGFIEKDPQTGEPTGFLRDTAQQSVFSRIPMYPDEAWERALKRAMQLLTGWGVTGFNDMSTNAPQLRVYQKMDREGSGHGRLSRRGSFAETSASLHAITLDPRIHPAQDSRRHPRSP